MAPPKIDTVNTPTPIHTDSSPRPRTPTSPIRTSTSERMDKQAIIQKYKLIKENGTLDWNRILKLLDNGFEATKKLRLIHEGVGDLKSLNTHIRECREKVGELEAQKIELENNISITEARLKEFEHNIHKKQGKNSVLSEENKKLIAERDDLRETGKNLQESLKILTNTIEEENKKFKAAKDKLADLQQKIEGATSELTTLGEQRTTLNASIASLTEEEKRTKENIAKAQADEEQAKKKHNTTQVVLDELGQKFKELKSQKIETEKELEELKALIFTTKNELEETKTGLEEQNGRLTTEIAKLEKKHKNIQGAIDRKSKQLSDLKENRNTAEKEKKDELARLQLELDEKVQKLKETSNQIGTIETLSQTIEKLEQELLDEQTKTKDAQRRHQETTREYQNNSELCNALINLTLLATNKVKLPTELQNVIETIQSFLKISEKKPKKEMAKNVLAQIKHNFPKLDKDDKDDNTKETSETEKSLLQLKQSLEQDLKEEKPTFRTSEMICMKILTMGIFSKINATNQLVEEKDRQISKLKEQITILANPFIRLLTIIHVHPVMSATAIAGVVAIALRLWLASRSNNED